ncbi:MAG: BatA domain-containing protein, partial [Candidatus Kapaibacterium sp.]
MFLNNIILFSLIAVAVPILLHLLNLQKVRKMEFSTLMFLKEIQKSKFRRIHIKHFLLLLVRIAIIVFLVLAFADPFLRGYSGKGSNSQKLGIVFIDSSFSMLYNKDSANLFNKALSLTARISNTYSSSDELITIVTKVQSDTSHNYIPVKPNLNSILNKANDILKNRNQNTSEIFIISDLQKVNFHDNLYQPNKYSNFYFIDVAENEQPNISISNLIIESKILGISFPVKLKVIVRNHTSNFLTDEKLTLFINDNFLEEKYFDINPNEIKPIDFLFKPVSVGIQTLKAELVSSNKQLNAFNEDNLYFKQIYIPEKINIGIISESMESSKYIRAVFDAANLNSQGEKVYNYTESSKLNNLMQYDVLYLCGLKGFSESDIENINKFSETGKMIIIFLSEEMNIDDYNKIKGIKISTLNKVNTDASISEINTESALFHDLFKSKKGETFNSSTLEGINLKSYFSISPSQNSNVLLSLSVPNSNAQIPLIIASDPSYNNIQLITVSSDISMSSFPSLSLFAPFILRSAYLSLSSSLFPISYSLFSARDTLESNPDLINENVLKTVLNLSGVNNYNIVPQNKLQSLENIITYNRGGYSLWFIFLIVPISLIPIEIYL